MYDILAFISKHVCIIIYLLLVVSSINVYIHLYMNYLSNEDSIVLFLLFYFLKRNSSGPQDGLEFPIPFPLPSKY